MKTQSIDYGDERRALFVMEIQDAFAQQTERSDGNLNDIEFEDDTVRLNGEFDLRQIAWAVMNRTASC